MLASSCVHAHLALQGLRSQQLRPACLGEPTHPALELPGCFACEVGTPISEVPQSTRNSARSSLTENGSGHMDHPSCKRLVHCCIEGWRQAYYHFCHMAWKTCSNDNLTNRKSRRPETCTVVRGKQTICAHALRGRLPHGSPVLALVCWPTVLDASLAWPQCWCSSR